MGEMALGFALAIVALVVFMVLSYWQLRRVHGAQGAADPDAEQVRDTDQADDAGEST